MRVCELVKKRFHKNGVGASDTVTESARKGERHFGMAVLVDNWNISERLPEGVRAKRSVRAAEGRSFTKSWRSSRKVSDLKKII